MSFDNTEKGTLCEILECSPFTLDVHLDAMSTALTTEVESLVRDDIDLWATYRDDFMYSTAGPAHWQGRDDPAMNRTAIRKRIANWIDFDLQITSSSGLIRA